MAAAAAAGRGFAPPPPPPILSHAHFRQTMPPPPPRDRGSAGGSGASGVSVPESGGPLPLSRGVSRTASHAASRTGGAGDGATALSGAARTRSNFWTGAPASLPGKYTAGSGAQQQWVYLRDTPLRDVGDSRTRRPSGLVIPSIFARPATESSEKSFYCAWPGPGSSGPASRSSAYFHMAAAAAGDAAASSPLGGGSTSTSSGSSAVAGGPGSAAFLSLRPEGPAAEMAGYPLRATAALRAGGAPRGAARVAAAGAAISTASAGGVSRMTAGSAFPGPGGAGSAGPGSVGPSSVGPSSVGPQLLYKPSGSSAVDGRGRHAGTNYAPRSQESSTATTADTDARRDSGAGGGGGVGGGGPQRWLLFKSRSMGFSPVQGGTRQRVAEVIRNAVQCEPGSRLRNVGNEVAAAGRGTGKHVRSPQKLAAHVGTAAGGGGAAAAAAGGGVGGSARGVAAAAGVAAAGVAAGASDRPAAGATGVPARGGRPAQGRLMAVTTTTTTTTVRKPALGAAAAGGEGAHGAATHGAAGGGATGGGPGAKPLPRSMERLVGSVIKAVSGEKARYYYVEKLIQQAIFGGVFLAYEGETRESSKTLKKAKRKVALKVISKNLERLNRGRIQEDAFAEVLFASAMRHHRNVLVHDHFWTDPDNMYLAMEFAEHEDLFEVLKKYQRPLDEPKARFLFRQILEGAAFLNKKGVAFRDHSLENVLMFAHRESPDGPATFVPKITDPGQAVFIAFDSVTKAVKNLKCERLFGKNFRPPEITLQSPYNPIKVDTFCLGWMLFYIVMRTPAFNSATPSDAKWALIADGVTKGVLKKNGGPVKLSSDLLDLIFSMLHPDPRKRPTPSECLKHPWFRSGPTQPFGPEIFSAKSAGPGRSGRASSGQQGGSAQVDDNRGKADGLVPSRVIHQQHAAAHSRLSLGGGRPMPPPSSSSSIMGHSRVLPQPQQHATILPPPCAVRTTAPLAEGSVR